MRALTFEYGATEEARAFAEALHMELTVARVGSVRYRDMPEFLRRFDVYIDAKRRATGEPIIPALSLTALQATACGLKVVKLESPGERRAPPRPPPPRTGFLQVASDTLTRMAAWGLPKRTRPLPRQRP